MSERDRKPSATRPPPPSGPYVSRTPTPRDPRDPLPSRTTTSRDPVVPRTVTPQHAQPSQHPIGTPHGGLSPNAGTLAVAAWLRDRGLYAPIHDRWRVQIALEVNDRPASFMFASTKFQLTIDPDSWGFLFVHGDRTSAIEVTNLAAARDGDEHRLLGMTPALKRIGSLVRDLEARYHVFFPRHHAAVRSDLLGSEPMIRAWVSGF
ncbi:MAG: hypothetical protein M3680_04820 [Myxococcota bacterium]|nr:hypothetical protein [Myxococcota bacterium]